MTEGLKSKLVLVVGPPRSGSSVIARILHEKLNVCMGHNLYPGNPSNPLGFYEDIDVTAAIKEKNVGALIETIGRVHSSNEAIIGVKSSELAFIDMEALKPSLVIRTRRGISDIAHSLAMWHSPKVDYSRGYILARYYEREIDKNLDRVSYKRVYNLLLATRHSDREIVEELRGLVNSIG